MHAKKYSNPQLVHFPVAPTRLQGGMLNERSKECNYGQKDSEAGVTDVLSQKTGELSCRKDSAVLPIRTNGGVRDKTVPGGS